MGVVGESDRRLVTWLGEDVKLIEGDDGSSIERKSVGGVRGNGDCGDIIGKGGDRTFSRVAVVFLIVTVIPPLDVDTFFVKPEGGSGILSTEPFDPSGDTAEFEKNMRLPAGGGLGFAIVALAVLVFK